MMYRLENRAATAQKHLHLFDCKKTLDVQFF